MEKNIDDADTNAFRYCGEYYDSETGTIYLRARHYNPSNGRFTQRDSFAGKQGDPLSLNLYTYCHNNPIVGVDPSGHIFKSIGNWISDRADDWSAGIDIMHSMGGGWSVAASYSEGVVDSGEAIGNAVIHPIDTISNAWSDFEADPLNNNFITQTVTGVGDFYTGLWNASSNGDWNSVGYSLGGATTNVAVIGGTSLLGAGAAKAIAPNGISASFKASFGGQFALAGGGTAGNAFAVSIAASSSQVVAAGAVAGGTLAGSNVMFASNFDKGKTFRGGSKSSRDNWYGYNDKDFQKWWHREGKSSYGHDILDSDMATDVYQEWVDLGKPKVK